MRIGVPKEIKQAEQRVGMTPGSVREAVVHGHHVVVETNAGVGMSPSPYQSGMTPSSFEARLASSAMVSVERSWICGRARACAVSSVEFLSIDSSCS